MFALVEYPFETGNSNTPSIATAQERTPTTNLQLIHPKESTHNKGRQHRLQPFNQYHTKKRHPQKNAVATEVHGIATDTNKYTTSIK
jgi:hypothetical protein